MKTEILGVNFDALTMAEALAAAKALLSAGKGGRIVTVNSEILLLAQRDASYLSALESADLVLPDGIGVVLASRIVGNALAERVAGADLVPELLKALAAGGGSVFLYGARPGVAARAALSLRRMFPGLNIAGTEHGFVSDESALWAALNARRPDLLLLGLGAPRQELWMAEHRQAAPLMIGVGGLLDVLAGDVPRAPARWRAAGLEWPYRALVRPERLVRLVKLPLVLLLAGKERLRRLRGARMRGQRDPFG